MNPDGGVHFPPPIARFVGSDALAVVAATRLATKKRPSMAIDIGTNAEIALAHDGRVTVTSCASGPAFEGYQIRNGMKAVAGAIEYVKIAAGEATEIVTITGATSGSAGPAWSTCLAGLVHAGVVDRSGRMQTDHPRVRKGEEGVEYLLTAGPHGDIVFTQHDVRSLQLAKGAIHAGWELLIELDVPLEELDPSTSPARSAPTSTWTRRSTSVSSRRSPRAGSFRRRRRRRQRADRPHRREGADADGSGA